MRAWGLTVFFLAPLSLVARGGEIGYDPSERTMARADLIVIATQTGPISSATEPEKEKEKAIESPFVVENEPWDKLFISDFVVKEVIKGRYEKKTIRVRSSRHDGGGGHFEPFTVEPGQTVVLQLGTASAGEREWRVLGYLASMYPIEAGKTGEVFRDLKGQLARLMQLRRDALAEMEAFSPESVKKARALLPTLLKAPRAKLPEPDSFGIIREPLPSSKGPPWDEFAKADVRVLRALGILSYLVRYVPEFDAVVETRAAKLAEDEAKIAREWFGVHFRSLKVGEGLDGFARAHPGLIARIFLRFPPSVTGRYGYAPPEPGERLMAVARTDEAEQGPEVETEVSRTLLFLVYAEDPGCYELSMRHAWAYWTREFGGEKGKGVEPVFGRMRLPWVREKILEWLKPEADSHRRKVALTVMNENPGPWVREWIEAERKRADKDKIADLAAPAAGLADAKLVLALWKEAIERGASERSFCWWLRYVRYFDSSLAAFALERWKAAVAGAKTEKDKRRARRQLSAYLEAYHRHLTGKSKYFESPAEAEKWLETIANKKGLSPPE